MHSIFLPRPSGSATKSPTPDIRSSREAHPRVTSIAVAEWPLWARAISKMRSPADTGLGDTIVHLIGDSRSDKFKRWFQRKFGKSCGCTERQRWLNRKFPYAVLD